MKNKKPVKNLPISNKPKSDLKLSYSLLLLGYVLLPVITPNFYTIDTAGPKFLSLCLLNLIGFITLFKDSFYKQKPELWFSFFKNPIGIAYSLLLCITLLSFFNAINLTESLINFTKAATVFASTYVLYIIFKSNRKYLNFLAVAVTLILLVDCVTVFYNILKYIAGDIQSIYDIKSVYSNKNILSSALFVKIPAAMFLIFFTKGWTKILGYITVACAALATLLMSTRTFYLGLAVLLLAIIGYTLLRFLAERKAGSLLMIGRWVGLFILAAVLYTVAQKFLYPKKVDYTYNVGIISRISSIKTSETSANMRLGSWNRTIKLIKEYPLLGVGTGNWKVQVLKYENLVKSDYIYMYKNHNDFLEITAETGIFGGLAFVSIFLLILGGFARSCLQADAEESKIKYLFLPAFGILAYAVDAFFNFPADRPEIQALFAIYVSMAVAFNSPDKKPEAQSHPQSLMNKKLISGILAVIVLILLLSITWILFLNAKSLRFMRFVKEDLAKKNLQHSSAMIIAGFPSIPNLTVDGEPVAVNKSRYLLNEKKYREAINMLLPDQSSPWDSRKEYFLTMAYQNLGMPDSAIYYIGIANRLKPMNAKAARVLSSLLWEKGKRNEAVETMEKLLQKVKNNPESYSQAVNYQLQLGNSKKAMTILDTAIKYLPRDTNIINSYRRVDYLIKRAPLEGIYSKAIKAFSSSRYPECLTLLNEFISKQPNLAEAYQMRAYCYYYSNQYQKSLNDVNKFFTFGGKNYFLINLRGINLRALGNLEEACKDFKWAMDNGNPDGKANYLKYCIKQ